MAFRRLGNLVTLDKTIAALVAVGSVAVLQEADEQGRAPLVGAVSAAVFGRWEDAADRISKVGIGASTDKTDTTNITRRRTLRLNSEQCQLLERRGYLIVDNFLTAQQVQAAQESIRILDSYDQFQMSSNQKYELDETSGCSVRTDRVFMNQLLSEAERPSGRIQPSDEKDINKRVGQVGTGLLNVQTELGLFARAFTESDFAGFKNESVRSKYRKEKLEVPAQMQVTIFDKSRNQDDPDDYFTSHLDSAAGEGFWSLGVLGWLKSKYVRQRYLTCIVYLNSSWTESDGGCLRLHDSEATMGTFDSKSYTDVAPLAGRLVIFSSRTQWHAVLPTFATRYACSVWLTLDDGAHSNWKW